MHILRESIKLNNKLRSCKFNLVCATCSTALHHRQLTGLKVLFCSVNANKEQELRHGKPTKKVLLHQRETQFISTSSLKCPEEPGRGGRLGEVLLFWWGVRLPYPHISHRWAWSPGHRPGTGTSQDCWRRCRWDRSWDLCTHLYLRREIMETLFDSAVTTTSNLKQYAQQSKKATERSER